MNKTTVSLLLLTAVGALLPLVACGSKDKGPGPVAPSPPSASAAPTESAAPAASSAAPAASASASGGANGKFTAADCKKLLDEANENLDAERIKVDKLCKKDNDCMVIKGRACKFVCPNAAIPKLEEDTWNGAVTEVKNGPCREFARADCENLMDKRPEPKCQDKKAKCEQGHCVMR